MRLSQNSINSFRVVLCIALAAIMYLATTPQHYPVVESVNDKVNHILAFFVLGLLADFSVPRSGFTSSKIGALLAYGLGIEVIQFFLPYRTFSLLDWLADGIGLALYGFFLPVVRSLPWFSRRWVAPVTGTKATD
jgi:VanZ family protein